MKYDFYEFKKEEYEKRLNALREIMQEKKIDAIILTEEENIRWISGYWVFTMQDGSMPSAIIIPYSDHKEPVMLLAREGTGEDLSWIKNIKYWEEDFDTYLQADKGKVLLDSLLEFGPGISRIGIEAGNGMRVNLEQKDIDYFRKETSQLTISDISSEILGLRSIKSEAEIEKMRRASEITSKSLKLGFKDIKEGITERKLGQNFAKYFFEYGATGISHIGVSFGELAIKYAHSDPREYPLKPGEIAKVDIGCTFEGYRCDMYRMACIGKPGKKEAEVASTIIKANQAVIENIKDGVGCSELHDIALNIFEKAGLGFLLRPSNYIGHGLGLGVHEPPYIYRNSSDILKSGMVLAIEPWTYDDKDFSLSMNIEDVVVVRENSCEILTPVDRDIFIIS